MTDDISGALSKIMSDPEAMKEIQSLGQMLGLGGEAASEPEPEVEAPISGEALGAITKLVPLLNMTKEEDDTSRLLAALRPFLGEEKRRKLDAAKRMLRIMKLLPALKEGGIFEMF